MKNRSNRGSTLFAVLFFIVVLSAFAGAAFTFTSGTATVSQRSSQMVLGYGVADATMELVYSRWRAIVAAHTTKNLTSQVFVNTGSPYNNLGIDITKVTMADLGFPTGYLGLPDTISDSTAALGTTAGTVTIQLVDVYGVAYLGAGDDIPSPGANFLTAMAASNDFYAVNMTYDVQVKINVPSRNGPVPIGIRRRFQRANANAAQAAIFFENRLELFPGSNMTIAGRVHTNGDFYQATRSATTDLEFLKKVTYAGTNYNVNASASTSIVADGYVTQGYSDATMLAHTDNQGGDPARFQSGTPTQSSPMVVGGIDRQYLQPYNASTNQNYNNNSLREIIERPVKQASAVGDPSTTAFNSYWDVPTTGDAAVQQEAVEAARLYNQASIKISLVYNSDGTLNTTDTIIRGKTPDGMADGPEITGTDRTNILAALNQTTGGSRFAVIDRREGTANPVQTTSVNIATLKTAILAMTQPFNGILYIADVTGQDATTNSYNNGITTTNLNGLDYETVGNVATGARVKHAIMLTNGSDLPGSQIADVTDPLRAFSVATENGVYIKGDYNTGGTAGNVPSNSGSPTADTFAPGYTPVTAAIMADAVAVVSSRFNPAAGGDGYFDNPQSTITPGMSMAMDPVTGLEVAPGTVGAVSAVSRGAVSTTVNTAIVSGIFQNTATDVGGGASNLLRYMENWGQVPNSYVNTHLAATPDLYPATGSNVSPTSVTYKGSLMQSFFSKEFDARWRGSSGGTYNAPTRIVRFDDSFINKPPAGFPGTITYVKGAWERLL